MVLSELSHGFYSSFWAWSTETHLHHLAAETIFTISWKIYFKMSYLSVFFNNHIIFLLVLCI